MDLIKIGKIIAENFAKQYDSEINNIKEACEKKFGINIEDIKHMKLKNGVDIISFYDEKLNRNRIINYTYAKSLVDEFTNIQNNNISFQGNDYSKNANDIAKSEANNNLNREFNMIYIEDLKNNYSELIQRIPNLDEKKLSTLRKLVSESEARKIKYINLENMIGLDENGRIIESVIDERTKEPKLETPEDYKSNVSEVSNEEKIDEITNDVLNGGYNNFNDSAIDEDQIDSIPTDYESEEIIVSEEDLDLENEMRICNINGDREVILGRIKTYASDMSKLDSDFANNELTEEEFNFYEMICTKYQNQLEQKKTYKKTLSYDQNNNGFISVLIISIITLVIAVIVTLFIMNK